MGYYSNQCNPAIALSARAYKSKSVQMYCTYPASTVCAAYQLLTTKLQDRRYVRTVSDQKILHQPAARRDFEMR